MIEYRERIRVLLIEHNRLLLAGLTQLLLAARDIEIASTASSASAGLALFQRERPRVTVIDLEIPDTAGDLVKEIRLLEPDAIILILATYELDGAGAAAIARGATAVIAKDQISSRLVPLIRSLVAG